MLEFITVQILNKDKPFPRNLNNIQQTSSIKKLKTYKWNTNAINRETKNRKLLWHFIVITALARFQNCLAAFPA